MTHNFGWKPHVVSVKINKSQEIKSYGHVCRNGKLFFRNYRRELKNGKGLSLFDLIDIRLKKAQKEVQIKISNLLFEDLIENVV